MKKSSLRYFYLFIVILGLALIPSPIFAKDNTLKLCTLVFDKNIVLQNVPLAENEEQQKQGLSGKDSVGIGMLFSKSEPLYLTFWMKNTKVPLSVGFFSENGELFQIEDMQPETQTLHHSIQPTKYALELPLGKFAAYGLKIGSKLNSVRC